LLGLNKKLKDLKNQGRSIKVAVAGVGQMGRGLVSHIRELDGIRVVAVANRDIERICSILREIDISDDEVILAGSGKGKGKKIDQMVKEDKIIVSDDLDILFSIDCVDIIIGPELKKLADKAGVVYTVSAGDEPAALKELYDFADVLGLEVVAAGKGKNNPLDRYANPKTLKDYAQSKGSSPRMMTSFVDGTKSMIEMACLSNSTGLVPDCRGMHGPRADIKDLINVFSLKKDGGILSKKGVVDFAIGDLAPGVFLVYTTENKTVKADLEYLMLGSGPYYLLYRPYHLTSIETPISIARAYFYHEPTIVPEYGMVSEVVTLAKKDLRKGEKLDGIGGYAIYGLIEEYEKAKRESLLPVGLSESCVLKKDIEKDSPIKYDDVDLGEDSLLLKIRRSQDKTIKNNK
jgi:predicted homoserine dehydrogenase-like protein